MNKPLRSSAAIYMCVKEYDKIFTSFCKVHLQRVSDFYALQSLNTRVDCALILLVQFHHINDSEGRGVCVSVVLKIYWSNFIKCSHLNMEV